MAIGAQTPLDGAMIAELVRLTASAECGELMKKQEAGCEPSPPGSSRKSRAYVILRRDSARPAKTKRALGDHTASGKSEASSFTFYQRQSFWLCAASGHNSAILVSRYYI
jgi:hypothetical protein